MSTHLIWCSQTHTGVRRGQMSNDAIGQFYVPDRMHVSTGGCGLLLIFKDADLGHTTLLETRVNSSLFSATWQLHMAPIYDRLLNNKINVRNCKTQYCLFLIYMSQRIWTHIYIHSRLILRKQSLIDTFMQKWWLQPCKVTIIMISTLSQ